jgi:NADPH:quinone reductase-like Zn-dependent oxidoreductase
MRAIVMHHTGGPEVLRLEEVPAPTAGPGQVLVRTEAIGTFAGDTGFRSGRYPVPPLPGGTLPVVLGNEAAGTVTAVGDGVDPALVGTRVAVLILPTIGAGTYAEYVAAPVDALTPVPAGLPATHAVAIATQAALALSLLSLAAPAVLDRGDGGTILVTVGAAGIGGYLTQLLRARLGEPGARPGARIIATAGGQPARRQRARELGADIVVDHTDPGWPDRVRDALAGGTIDLVYDSIGGPALRALLPAVTPLAGRLVCYGNLSGQPIDLTVDELRARNLTVIANGSPGGGWAERVSAARADALQLAVTGRLRPLIDSELPLGEAAEAHRRLEQRLANGKIVLLP